MEREKELWGRKFKIVNNGLDEADVYSFVDSLTHQYSKFAKKLEHLDSLVGRLANQHSDLARKLNYPTSPLVDHDTQHHTDETDDPESDFFDSPTAPTNGNTGEADRDKLENLDSLTKFAERTVIEAVKQAKSIKAEIEQRTKAEASSMIAHATAEAERIVTQAELRAQQRSAEILAASPQKAQEIIEAAEHETPPVKASDRGESGRHVSQAKQADEQKAQDIIREFREKAEGTAQFVNQKAEQLLAKGQRIGAGEIKRAFADIQQKLLSLPDVLEGQPAISAEEARPPANSVETEASEIVPTESIDEESREHVESGQEESEESASALFGGIVELALPPPVALDRMLQLHKHLKETQHVDVLNLGGSVDKGITIRILVDSPTPLLKIIGELPEVGEASEELPESQEKVPSRQGGNNGRPIRRIIIIPKG